MITGLSVLRNVLPRGRAWRALVDNTLRRWLTGVVTPIFDGIRAEADSLVDGWQPQYTDRLDEWEAQFSLPQAQLTEQERRDRLEAAWKRTGGQSAYYIEQTLRGAGFDVYVHTWWEEAPATFEYGSGDEYGTGIEYGESTGGVAVLTRLPTNYVDTYPAELQVQVEYGQGAEYGEGLEYGVYESGGFPLVNIIYETRPDFSVEYGIGGEYGEGLEYGVSDGFRNIPKRYTADNENPNYWYYIGGENFPEFAQIPKSRQYEFEELILKIGPAHLWAGVLVRYI